VIFGVFLFWIIKERLEHVDLSYNNIRVIPLAICSLEKLQELLLSHNKIQELPFTLGRIYNVGGMKAALLTFFLQLQVIEVAENELKSLPRELLNNRRLKKLVASSNPFENENLKSLCDHEVRIYLWIVVLTGFFLGRS